MAWIITIDISYSNIQGGQASIEHINGGTVVWGAGNLDTDPNFTDAGYWLDPIPGEYDDDTWVEGNYHLQWFSECVDTGEPNDANIIGTTDLDGLSRLVDGDCNDTDIVDMGAYEFQGIPGDFEPDGDVDANDLDFFTNHWLYTDCNDVNDWCDGTDLDYSHTVNFNDFAILAKYWQAGK